MASPPDVFLPSLCTWLAQTSITMACVAEPGFAGFKIEHVCKSSDLSPLHFQVGAFRERRALSLTLNDTKTAVKKLHQMVNFAVAIIVVVIWLLILGIATTRLLVFISSQVLLLVFVFGNACKTVFEAIIFLFAMHPFDVGDRCEVDGVQVLY